MSNTTVDLAKVTQMLDAGWEVRFVPSPCGPYSIAAAAFQKTKPPYQEYGPWVHSPTLQGAIDSLAAKVIDGEVI